MNDFVQFRNEKFLPKAPNLRVYFVFKKWKFVASLTFHVSVVRGFLKCQKWKYIPIKKDGWIQSDNKKWHIIYFWKQKFPQWWKTREFIPWKNINNGFQQWDFFHCFFTVREEKYFPENFP